MGQNTEEEEEAVYFWRINFISVFPDIGMNTNLGMYRVKLLEPGEEQFMGMYKLNNFQS